MRIWLALLGAPILALMDQAIAYGTAGWSCANQNLVAMQLTHGFFFAVTLGASIAAWQRWRETRGARELGDAAVVRHFLAGIATASGALSALVIFAMWMATWIVMRCFNG
jgi:hypothetical protein